MTKNKNIITEFEKLIDQIKYDIDHAETKSDELKHSFRLRQISNALKTIKKYPTVIKSGEELKDIKGIGKGIINRINEILKTGKLSEIKVRKKEKKYQDYINELEQIFGIGRKTAYELVTKHNIKSVKGLKEAYEKGKIELTEQMKTSLKYYDEYKQTIPRAEIKKVDQLIQKYKDTIDSKLEVKICGSYRRKKPTSNDIDILISHPQIKTKKKLLSSDVNYLHEFVKVFKKLNLIVGDLTYEDYETKYMGYCRYPDKNKKYPIRRVDIYYAPYDSYHSFLLHLTGSGEFNRKMRLLAIELGYKLNEYGLFKAKDHKFTKIHVESEKDIFNKLGMEYIKPENRG